MSRYQDADVPDRKVRLLFPTQSNGLLLFWRLSRVLADERRLEAAGFFATNRLEHQAYLRAEPALADTGLDMIREWELLDRARALPTADLQRIAEWERTIGDPTLWNALIVDRRLGSRLRAQFVQDYRAPYGHAELLKILDVALDAISDQFDRIRPHAVIGLNPVTMYDYLYYLIARHRRIPYLQLKLTRIRNYVSLYSDPFDLSPHIRLVFERLRDEGPASADEAAALRDARELMAEIRGDGLRYEGAIDTPGRARTETHRPATRLTRARRRVGEWLRKAALAARYPDPHYPTPLRNTVDRRVIKAWRHRTAARHFDIDDSEAFLGAFRGHYALYPLNTEPEVALLAYGRPYRNQIETVRNVASSLPVGWKLVVKEHPNAHGYRTPAYYRKLKQIPNVLLAGPMAKTGRLIDGASLVAVVFGTIGLEAIIKNTPVLAVTSSPYGSFSRELVRYADRPWHWADDVRDLLATYRPHDEEPAAFIAAHMLGSIRLNLFTALLGKTGRQRMDAGLTLAKQYAALARYALQRIAEEERRLSPREGAISRAHG